jgi:hypothetical protein
VRYARELVQKEKQDKGSYLLYLLPLKGNKEIEKSIIKSSILLI